MNIIDFFKAFFRLSKNETQDSPQTSNLDLINVQPSPVDYTSLEKEQTISEGKNDALPDDIDAAVDPTIPKSETIITHDDTIEELKAFVDEVDKENPTGTKKNEDNDNNIEESLIIPVYEEVSTSLLDNAPYMSLAESCCELFKELEKQQSKDNSELIDLIKKRIKEGLFLSGAEPIAEETSYDVIRHTAVGKSIVRKGTPITSTLEPGVAIDDKVMIKAKVQL